MNPPVITETDSVTLNCQTPSSVSVSQCYFYIVSGGMIRGFSCLKTLRGTELLLKAQKSSSAEVEVKCFYTVKFGELESPSPHSDTSSITIHSEWLLSPYFDMLSYCKMWWLRCDSRTSENMNTAWNCCYIATTYSAVLAEWHVVVNDFSLIFL